jgi:hypothetical protein
MSNGIISTLVGAGILVANLLMAPADGHAKQPRPPTFPPIDPLRVDCTAFRRGNAEQCYKTANEVYQLHLLILSQYEAGDFPNAGLDVVPHMPTLFPDGTVTAGVGPETFPVLAALVDSTDFAFVAIDDAFIARVLDKDTVILFGPINFTILDHAHGGTLRTLHHVQTALFRQNRHMPRGWELTYEQIGYQTPLLGDQ